MVAPDLVFSLVPDTDPPTIGNKFRRWQQRMDMFVIVPDDLFNYQGRVRAFVSNSKELQANICIRYAGRPVFWMTFDGRYEEWDGDKMDYDNRCGCF